jgi:hypothetical protein
MNSHDVRNVAPVANPSLAADRGRRMIRKAMPPAGRSAPMRQVLHRDEVVAPLALDVSCRQLLLRVQHAIARSLKSGVYVSNLHRTMPEIVLKQHEWEIAVALRDISELRAEYAASASAGGQGPMTAAVLAPQRHALALAQDATASRVSALECYAEQLEAADNAQRDWQSALRIAGLNDKFLDLVARTAADQYAVAEITSLTEQAAAAAQAFQDSLQQATLAAEALVLPVNR